MQLENLLNATQATQFLGLKHRQSFYDLKEKAGLEPSAKVGNMPLYSIKELRKLKVKK